MSFRKPLQIFLIFVLLLLPQFAHASSITPKYIPGPDYPSGVEMHVGDVLYSHKTLGSSSQIVGHVGIVGPDYRIYHVTPAVNGGTADNLSTYLNRHGRGETITVYKHRYTSGVQAAQWAKNNYYSVKEYSIQPFSRLKTINPNYCSKFLWQAFWYGENYDVVEKNFTPEEITMIYPLTFTTSSFAYQTQFITP